MRHIVCVPSILISVHLTVCVIPIFELCICIAYVFSIVPENEVAITAEGVCRQIDMDGALSIRGAAICAP